MVYVSYMVTVLGLSRTFSGCSECSEDWGEGRGGEGRGGEGDLLERTASSHSAALVWCAALTSSG